MKREIKITITIIVIVLIGLVGFVFWSLSSGQKIIWTTETGEERGINIPKIPGMELVSEEKGECFYQANYVYTLYKDKDVSDYIKKPAKDAFIDRGWELDDERIEDRYQILDFSTKKAGELERVTIKIGFEQGKGTIFSLIYKWPPRQEEK